MSDVFQIRTGKTTTRPHPVAESFDLLGHKWVVHTSITSEGYRVSHCASGYGVPNSSGDTVEQAKAFGVAYLTEKRDKIDEVIKQVST